MSIKPRGPVIRCFIYYWLFLTFTRINFKISPTIDDHEAKYKIFIIEEILTLTLMKVY